MTVGATSVLRIDLGAFAHNLAVVREYVPPGCAILAVVKANAYGHGAAPIAQKAVEEGAAMLGVANLLEAIEIRDAGIIAPILIMMQPPQDALEEIIDRGFRLTISDRETAERVGDIARQRNKIAYLHCKIDTGMGRQGFPLQSVDQELKHITRVSNVDIEGIATHFPVADAKDSDFTDEQVRIFKQLLKQLEKVGIPYEKAHAANSAAAVHFPDSAFDMVRVGLMTYGVWPGSQVPENNPLRPVLHWETKIGIVKQFDAGSTIGYGRTYNAKETIRGAVLPVGYADGYKHALSNRADVLIHGKRCPIRGAVSMDQIVVDVSDVPEAAMGDRAVLIGADGSDRITVEELSERGGILSYELLANLCGRVRREYTS